MKKYTILLALFFISMFCIMAMPVIAQGKDANVSVNVEKVDSATSLFTIIVLAITFVILLIVVLYLLKFVTMQQRKKNALKEKIAIDDDENEYKQEHKEDTSSLAMDSEVDKYLKEDEKAVVTLLRQRGGVVSQSTLRIAGDFSKATLSRLLKELEDRNVVKKEKRGKKNLVILK
ncbi:hypothetical protein GF345_05400 [Candidatus Woesearchaeota archaeon]|nr:hypothetical protein [Candidatus Woesearchaeota archaeon]